MNSYHLHLESYMNLHVHAVRPILLTNLFIKGDSVMNNFIISSGLHTLGVRGNYR